MAHPPSLLPEITAALQAMAEPEFRARQQSFSKEPILSIGVRTAAVRSMAKAYFPKVKLLDWENFWAECEVLLETGTVEHRAIAFTWAYQRRQGLVPTDFEILAHWLSRFVKDWMACDQLCCEVLGAFLLQYPIFTDQVVAWASSENRWHRRAASVALIPELRRTANFLPQLLQIADILLPDRDDLVQKGLGWALKISLDCRQEDTMDYLRKNESKMSRTAWRYALEKSLTPKKKSPK